MNPRQSSGLRFVVVVHQMSGPVDDEEFVGPFRSYERAEAARDRIERVGKEKGVLARVRQLHGRTIPAGEVVGWYA